MSTGCEICPKAAATSICDAGSFSNLLGEFVDQQVLVEASQLPTQFVCCNNGPAAQPHDGDTTLDHITEQTGLTWSEQTRTVRRLFVEKSR